MARIQLGLALAVLLITFLLLENISSLDPGLRKLSNCGVFLATLWRHYRPPKGNPTTEQGDLYLLGVGKADITGWAPPALFSYSGTGDSI